MSHFERAPALIAWAPLTRLLSLLATISTGMLALVVVGPRLPLGSGMASAGHWGTWLVEAGPPTALMTIVRLVGLLVGAYLLAVMSLDLVATTTRSPFLASLTGHVTLPFARRLITGVTGAGLAASLSIGIVIPTSATAVPQPSTSTSTAATIGGLPPPNRTMRRPDQAVAANPPPAAVSPLGSAPGRTWTIAPGDHLWKVSSHTLQAAWGRPPHDNETLRYLHVLIDTNRDVLVVPNDADLVFAGQVFALPDVPAA